MFHHACRLTKPQKIHKSYSQRVDLASAGWMTVEFLSPKGLGLKAIASRRNNASRSSSFAFSRKGFARIVYVLSLLPPGNNVVLDPCNLPER
jgi:hypothetical protein